VVSQESVDQLRSAVAGEVCTSEDAGYDQVRQIMVERFAQTPSIMTGMLVEHFHGAVTRVPPPPRRSRTASPAPTSSSPGYGPTPKTTTPTLPRCGDTHDILAPYMAGSVYVNYLADDDNSRVQAAYGPNWERLQQVKRAYDPDNVFHLNQNIAP
jgi:hypothetical protein